MNNPTLYRAVIHMTWLRIFLPMKTRSAFGSQMAIWHAKASKRATLD